MAKRQSDLMKNSKIPPECNVDNIGLWKHIQIWAFGDPCEKYHEMLYTDPVYQISPAKAFSDTIAIIILGPLEHAGTQIGKFIYNLLGTLNRHKSLVNFLLMYFSELREFDQLQGTLDIVT